MPVSQSDIISIFVVSAFVVLGLSLAIILFVVFYQKRMMQQNLQLQQLEQEKQQALLDASIQSQERERRRIAKDLHDEVGAMLSTVKLHIGQALKHSEASKASFFASEAKTLVEETIQNVRSISRDLLPATLEKFGLIAGLEELIARNNVSDQLQLHLTVSAQPYRMPIETELAIYRIVQELINNSIKHAEAQNILLTVGFGEHLFELIYRDDGKGFGKDHTDDSHGIGLRNIDSRVKVIGGASVINSLPGQGFEMHLQIELI